MPFRQRMPKWKTAKAREMRHAPTWAEGRMWEVLRQRPWGLKWRRQEPMLGWIADFYCASSRLVLEIDGGGHDASRDDVRDASMRAHGLRVLRITADSVYSDLDGVMAAIERVVRGKVAA